MFRYFNINQTSVEETDNEKFNWLIIQNSTEEERNQLIQEYQLPTDVFLEVKTSEVVSRFERLHETHLTEPILITLIDLACNKKEIEDCLKPVTFIYAKGILLMHLSNETTLVDFLLEEKKGVISKLEDIIMYSVLIIYEHYIKRLTQEKEKIDQLDQEARVATENEELFQLADVKRTMVYLEHTLEDQQETINLLLENQVIMSHFDNEALLYDVKLRQRYANKMVHIYRDLLESISDLISDMIDNNLNRIMKYLESAALVISIPTLFYGLWGMNTGGLPGENWQFGTLMIVLISFIVAIVVAIYLFRKSYYK